VLPTLCVPLSLKIAFRVFRPCDVFAHCTNTIGSYSCSCFPGYQGDGHQCQGRTLWSVKTSPKFFTSLSYIRHICLRSHSQNFLQVFLALDPMDVFVYTRVENELNLGVGYNTSYIFSKSSPYPVCMFTLEYCGISRWFTGDVYAWWRDSWLWLEQPLESCSKPWKMVAAAALVQDVGYYAQCA